MMERYEHMDQCESAYESYQTPNYMQPEHVLITLREVRKRLELLSAELEPIENDTSSLVVPFTGVVSTITDDLLIGYPKA